jgi:putative transposase
MSDACFRRSAGGVTSLGWHVVWCPRYRKGLLGDPVALRSNELLDQIAVENDWQIIAFAVMPDHVHTFVRVRPTDWPAEVARRSKGRYIEHQWGQAA